MTKAYGLVFSRDRASKQLVRNKDASVSDYCLAVRLLEYAITAAEGEPIVAWFDPPQGEHHVELARGDLAPSSRRAALCREIARILHDEQGPVSDRLFDVGWCMFVIVLILQTIVVLTRCSLS